MKHIIIVHGTGGHPRENWFPWIKSELEALDYTVHIPTFPTPEGQSLAAWLEVFEEYAQYMNKDTIVIGHSLGPAFLLHILEKSSCVIHAAFFVAGFTGYLGLPAFDTLNDSFVTKEFHWEKINKHCQHFCVINAADDPYVPLDKGKLLAERLNTTLITIPEGGHLNAAAGYTSFPLLLEKIKEVTSLSS